MADLTRREIARFKPEITRLLEEAAATGDTQAFVEWVQEYANNLPIERQAKAIATFKQILADEGARLRRRKKKKKK